MSWVHVAIRISSAPPDAEKATRHEQRRRLWQLFVQEADVWEHRYYRVMLSYFRRVREEVIGRLMGHGKAIEGQYRGWSRTKVVQHISRKSSLRRINIDLEQERRTLVSLFRPFAVSMTDSRGTEFLAKIGSGVVFNVNDPVVLGYLGDRLAQFSASVAGTTFNQIGITLQTGFAEGQPLSVIADTLRETFEAAERYRAPLIARTETISGLNKADLLAIQQGGLAGQLKKSWLTAGDEVVRPTHVRAGAEYMAKPIAVEELFRVGNDAMEAPGLGKDPAENINCRCTVLYQKVEGPPAPAPRPPRAPRAPRRRPVAVKPPPMPEPVVVPPKIPGPAGPAVSEALDVKTKIHGARVRQVLGYIDKTHGDGNLPKGIPIKTKKLKGNLGEYVFGSISNDARHISMNTGLSQDRAGLTIAHEVGHFIDHQGLWVEGRPTGFHKFASASGKHLQGFRDAVKETDAWKDLQALQAKVGQTVQVTTQSGAVVQYKIPAGHVRYLNDWAEIWARAYAQYVAEKGADQVMLAELRHLSSQPVYSCTQWKVDDFKPVREAIDKLFADLGWIK